MKKVRPQVKVWKVEVASRDDVPPTKNGLRPTRGVFFIEGIDAERKALRYAAESGIKNPIMKSIIWANCPLLRDFTWDDEL